MNSMQQRNILDGKLQRPTLIISKRIFGENL